MSAPGGVVETKTSFVSRGRGIAAALAAAAALVFGATSVNANDTTAPRTEASQQLANGSGGTAGATRSSTGAHLHRGTDARGNEEQRRQPESRGAGTQARQPAAPAQAVPQDRAADEDYSRNPNFVIGGPVYNQADGKIIPGYESKIEMVSKTPTLFWRDKAAGGLWQSGGDAWLAMGVDKVNPDSKLAQALVAKAGAGGRLNVPTFAHEAPKAFEPTGATGRGSNGMSGGDWGKGHYVSPAGNSSHYEYVGENDKDHKDCDTLYMNKDLWSGKHIENKGQKIWMGKDHQGKPVVHVKDESCGCEITVTKNKHNVFVLHREGRGFQRGHEETSTSSIIGGAAAGVAEAGGGMHGASGGQPPIMSPEGGPPPAPQPGAGTTPGGAGAPATGTTVVDKDHCTYFWAKYHKDEPYIIHDTLPTLKTNSLNAVESACNTDQLAATQRAAESTQQDTHKLLLLQALEAKHAADGSKITQKEIDGIMNGGTDGTAPPGSSTSGNPPGTGGTGAGKGPMTPSANPPSGDQHFIEALTLSDPQVGGAFMPLSVNDGQALVAAASAALSGIHLPNFHLPRWVINLDPSQLKINLDLQQVEKVLTETVVLSAAVLMGYMAAGMKAGAVGIPVGGNRLGAALNMPGILRRRGPGGSGNNGGADGANGGGDGTPPIPAASGLSGKARSALASVFGGGSALKQVLSEGAQVLGNAGRHSVKMWQGAVDEVCFGMYKNPIDLAISASENGFHVKASGAKLGDGQGYEAEVDANGKVTLASDAARMASLTAAINERRIKSNERRERKGQEALSLWTQAEIAQKIENKIKAAVRTAAKHIDLTNKLYATPAYQSALAAMLGGKTAPQSDRISIDPAQVPGTTGPASGGSSTPAVDPMRPVIQPAVMQAHAALQASGQPVIH